jgi:DNA polymerase kappa
MHQAKICSNKNKPNGQFRVPNDRIEIMKFMRDLPTRKVNGIGRVFERELGAIGVNTCGDIYEVRQYLPKLFGEKAFIFLMQCYLGLGRTNVKPAEEYIRKSVGTESTFGDMNDPTELRCKLRQTAEELEKDMQRTQFKGRTLCLKVKLNTYEVLTRQAAPPKAIYTADDLYRYSLPILEKLESEIPGMTLRLMGLRCTHLVSMKKPDTRAFFGFRKQEPLDSPNGETDSQSPSPGPKRKASALQPDSAEEWEVWPEELLFEDAERREREDELQELEHLSQLEEHDPRRHHGKEIVPNPKAKDVKEEEWWDCPVCQRPQPTSEKEFNEHIDLCLSRQTIRDVVQETASASGGVAKSQSSGGSAKKKDRGATPSDPKQRRLCF